MIILCIHFMSEATPAGGRQLHSWARKNTSRKQRTKAFLQLFFLKTGRLIPGNIMD
jgi:hypothetical protein